MWPSSELLDLLRIDHPILQAPMGGESTPRLAAAVSNAGGLGGLGCSYLSADEVRSAVGEIRAATNRPFNLNFFAHPEPRPDPAAERRARELVAPFYEELGIGPPPEHGRATCRSFDEARLAALLELRPGVVSFHFGLPPPTMVRALKDVGTRVLCTATTVSEARRLADAGVDAVIAQGWEAGGHRGTFEVTWEDFGVGTLALVPQVVDAVQVPVIAAGGIGDGRGVAAALVLGASGVQLGTAFLACPEANIDAACRQALREATDDDSRLTRAFSGRPARARSNRYIEAMAERRVPLPDYPTMYGFSEPLSRAATAAGRGGFEFHLWGQAAALIREMPAEDLVRRLVEETRAALARGAGR